MALLSLFSVAVASVPTGGSRQVWSFQTRDSLLCSPVLSRDGQTVYVGSCGDDNSIDSMYAVNAANGTKVWSFQTGGGMYFSPVLSQDGQTVYVGSGGDDNGENNVDSMYAVNAANGRKVWSFKAKGNLFGSAVLSQDGQTLYVGVSEMMPTAGNYTILYALDAATGSRMWACKMRDQASHTPFSFSPPVLSRDGRTVYLGTAWGPPQYGSLHAVDAANGAKLWSFQTR